MLKTLFMIGVATILTTLPAAAEKWVFVGRTQDKTDYYIDSESVQRSNDVTYLFWYMAVNPKPDEKGIVAQKSFVSMSCPLRGWRQQAIASFNAQGELVSREEFGDNEPLQFFTDGSVGQSLWKFVCQ
jgi:hypothetical protein